METFILISIVAIATFILVYLLLSVGNLEKEVETLKMENSRLNARFISSDKWLSGVVTAVSKDIGNLSLTFEDTRHKFETGWELASKMAADIEDDYVKVDADAGKTCKDWGMAADKATDRIVKYIADTIGNKDIEPERAEWLIRRYVRTVVGEITK